MFKKYIRTNIAEMRPVYPDDTIDTLVLDNISISETDKLNGSPSIGDMIARNPNNHQDKWLVAKKYFRDNFKEYKETSYESQHPELVSM